MWITNVPLYAVKDGSHRNPGRNSMLIQIVSPCGEFPKPAMAFREVHQFEFLDLEEGEMPDADEFKITQDQADQIVQLLKHAYDEGMNVVVHCEMGVCRSGAVTEVGVVMGFEDPQIFRAPNLLVKRRLFDAYERICL